jgi:lactoylglutathione lyase
LEDVIAEVTSAGDFRSGKLGIRHTAIQVADLDRSIAFYCELLGLEERDRIIFDEMGITEVFVGGPEGNGTSLDLIHVAGPEGIGTMDLIHQGGDKDSISAPTNILTHITLEMPRIAEVAKRLADAGFEETLRHEIQGVLIVFYSDPDGYFVELIGNASD